MKSLFSSKKSQMEMGIMPVIGMVLAVLVILATLALFTGLIKMFSGGSDEGSTAALKKMADSVDALVNTKNTNFTGCISGDLYIKPDWAIVGFNRQGLRSLTDTSAADEVEEYCSKAADAWTWQNVEKAKTCGGGSCLCLCFGGSSGDVDGNDCNEEKPTCINVYKGISRFYSDLGEREEQDIKGNDRGKNSDVVVYGEKCVFGKDKKVQPGFFIEKFSCDGRCENKGEYMIRITTPDASQIAALKNRNDVTDCAKLVKLVNEKVIYEQKQEEQKEKRSGAEVVADKPVTSDKPKV